MLKEMGETWINPECQSMPRKLDGEITLMDIAKRTAGSFRS